MATLLMRPGDGGSADKKRRARKGKNAQKKQPQRGLGVAQLEKLRLQEQSLLCPTPPSYALRLSATPSGHPMARCDTELSQTVLSLTTSNVHAQTGSAGACSGMVRGGEAGTVSRFNSLNGHTTTHNFLSPPVVHDISKGNGESVHASAERIAASRASACLSQSKFPSVNASFFANVLSATQLQMLERQVQAQQKAEERRAGNHAANASAYIFPSSNYLKEAQGKHVNDEGPKLDSVFKDHVQSRIPLTPTDLHYLETLISPDFPRKRIEFPVVGSPSNIVKTNSAKELSSLQSYSSQQAWSTAEKVSGRKRPWLALHDNARPETHSQGLDLNAPFVEGSDVGPSERSPVQPIQVPEFRAGAHYTTGIVRSALGNSSLPLPAKVKVCSPGSQWQGKDSPSRAVAFFPLTGMYSENAVGVGQCPNLSAIKDSCSSATGSSTFSRPGNSCFTDPELPSATEEKETISSNFLSLGISSHPGRNGWNEPEESIQDSTPTIMNDVRRLRQQDASTSGCEGHNHESKVRKSVYTEDIGGLQLRRSLSLEKDGSGTKRMSSMLLRDSSSHLPSPLCHYNGRFPLFPPQPSMASHSPGRAAGQSPIDYEPSAKSESIVEDILDLRLKLAL